MAYSEEIIRFKNHFERCTNIKVSDIDEHYSNNLKRLLFSSLDHIQMIAISKYIKTTFGKLPINSLPKIHTWGNEISLTVESQFINKFIPNE